MRSVEGACAWIVLIRSTRMIISFFLFVHIIRLLSLWRCQHNKLKYTVVPLLSENFTWCLMLCYQFALKVTEMRMDCQCCPWLSLLVLAQDTSVDPHWMTATLILGRSYCRCHSTSPRVCWGTYRPSKDIVRANTVESQQAIHKVPSVQGKKNSRCWTWVELSFSSSNSVI